MINKLLENDIKEFLNLYGKFAYEERSGKQYSILKGEVDICDVKGNYWNSFNIEIYIDKQKYPFCIPNVIENSKAIERESDWHISEEGVCCLDIDHKLEYLSKRGINIISFFQEKIYPFFANALYKKNNNGTYANGEYSHNFDGIVQFYKEKLILTDISKIIQILESIINNKIPTRNKLCLCGKNIKIKNCHLKAMIFLKSLSKDRILKDLDGFKNLNC
jgi:hypothetical protein